MVRVLFSRFACQNGAILLGDNSMDGYQFIAALFSSLVSLAWPAALVACVWLFREKLNALLPLLRMKYKDFDVSFRLDQAEKEAAAIPSSALPAPGATEPTPEEKDRFEKLAEISPRAAMLELRAQLEASLRTMAERAGVSAGKAPMTTLNLTRLLRNKNIIGPHTSALLDDLRVIGNNAAHGAETEFTKEDAMRFRILTDMVLDQLTVASMNVALM
jgi:hypothetical protein